MGKKPRNSLFLKTNHKNRWRKLKVRKHQGKQENRGTFLRECEIYDCLSCQSQVVTLQVHHIEQCPVTGWFWLFNSSPSCLVNIHMQLWLCFSHSDLRGQSNIDAHVMSCQLGEITLRTKPSSGWLTYSFCERWCRGGSTGLRKQPYRLTPVWSVLSFLRWTDVHLASCMSATRLSCSSW